MKIAFIADFFRHNGIGGAESNDKVLFESLAEKGHQLDLIHCRDLTAPTLNEYDAHIIGNFTTLSAQLKEALSSHHYVIYEHDHKYLATRDPSVYKDFKAPSDKIINREFYANAVAVVVLSKICKEVIEKNLNISNVHNIGCSLWSDEKLDFIQTLVDTPKNDKFGILESSNPIKGTHQAIAYCEKNNIEYEIIKSDVPTEPLLERPLLEKLAHYKGFVFFPKVLETFSRICAEAKFLNCQLITKPKLIGAASESVFKLSGTPLIEEMRRRRIAAVELFDTLLKKEKQPQNQDITVILNAYRRLEYLEEQIEAIRNQTIPPKQIWLWVNHHENNEDYDFSKLNVDRVFRNDFNWKYYGRFAASMLADTTYVALFDDDTIPGAEWFNNCLETMKATPGILGGAGVILESDQYVGHSRYGWSSANAETVEVDLVGHAWFFKQEWVKYLWMEKPYTWDNGEDIQFSYCCQKYGNIKTYCPPHPLDNPEQFSSLKGYSYGVDEKASSHVRNHELFYKQRNGCVENAIQNGWQRVKNR
mgnify:CR=1 FL=1